MILNLTQHSATPEQIAQGVVDLPDEARAELCALLTFDSLPTRDEIEERATAIADLAALESETEHGCCIRAMIGGAPFLMAALEGELRANGIKPLYAFSVRQSIEQEQPDGSVRKINVFRHVGFVRA